MHEARRRGNPGPAGGAVAAQPRQDPLDDWLGDVSDDDWSENAMEIAARRRATPAYGVLPVPEDDWPEPTADPPPRPVPAAEARSALVARRRLVAGIGVVVALALVVVIPVLVLRSQGQPSATPAPETEATGGAAPTNTETRPSSTATTPSTTTPSTTTPSTTTPSTTTPSTTTSTEASAFILPEGTKLQRGEADPASTSDLQVSTDPAVVTGLQQALTSAGYNPGPADGTFGEQTEAAVIAFQQANGLTADGIVGPETASALNSALASG